MLNWFNGLDTTRRLFVLGTVAFYLIFFYIKSEDFILFFRLLLFNQEAFAFQMKMFRQVEDFSAMGMTFEEPLSGAISGFKFLGVSVLATAALAYALFKGRKDQN